LSQFNFNLDKSDSFTYVSNHLSPSTEQAFINCLKIKNPRDFYATAKHIDNESVVVSVTTDITGFVSNEPFSLDISAYNGSQKIWGIEGMRIGAADEIQTPPRPRNPNIDLKVQVSINQANYHKYDNLTIAREPYVRGCNLQLEGEIASGSNKTFRCPLMKPGSTYKLNFHGKVHPDYQPTQDLDFLFDAKIDNEALSSTSGQWPIMRAEGWHDISIQWPHLFTVDESGEVEPVFQLLVCELHNQPNLQCMFTQSIMEVRQE
jgi:hypothetical protein